MTNDVQDIIYFLKKVNNVLLLSVICAFKQRHAVTEHKMGPVGHGNYLIMENSVSGVDESWKKLA